AGLHCTRPRSTPPAWAQNKQPRSPRSTTTPATPAAPPLSLVCATREHVRLPGHTAPCFLCAGCASTGQPRRPNPLYQTRQSTSPPRLARRDSWSVIRPLEVERIVRPIPPRTGLTFRLPA